MKTIIILFLTAIGIIVVSSMAYTVDQTEQVFITEFGKPVGKAINSDPANNEAGLHWKLPFIQQVNRIEKRILSWDGPASEMTTRDKLYVTVDNFARWRISDPQVYFTKLRNERTALSRLDDIIGSETLRACLKNSFQHLLGCTFLLGSGRNSAWRVIQAV